MFDLRIAESGEVVFSGRLDASQAANALALLEQIESDCTIDCKDLDYMSSAGIGVLIATFKRLHANGHGLKLRNLNQSIRKVLHYAGLTKVFEIGD